MVDAGGLALMPGIIEVAAYFGRLGEHADPAGCNP
jgi:hypothetical protein